MRANEREEFKALLTELVACAKEDVREPAPAAPQPAAPPAVAVKDGLDAIYKILGIGAVIVGIVLYIANGQSRGEKGFEQAERNRVNVVTLFEKLEKEHERVEKLRQAVWQQTGKDPIP